MNLIPLAIAVKKLKFLVPIQVIIGINCFGVMGSECAKK